jgi:hypothetical protein
LVDGLSKSHPAEAQHSREKRERKTWLAFGEFIEHAYVATRMVITHIPLPDQQELSCLGAPISKLSVRTKEFFTAEKRFTQCR